MKVPCVVRPAVWVSSLVVAAAPLILAQEQEVPLRVINRPDAPVKILSIKETHSATSVNITEMTIQNVSGKSLATIVTCFVVKLRGYPPHCATAMTEDGVGLPIAKPTPPGRVDTFNPLEQFTTTAERPIEWYEVRIDWVQFTDGETWGPDEFKYQSRILAERLGKRRARLWLKHLLDTQGVNALVEQVGKPFPFEEIRPGRHLHPPSP